MCSSSLTSCHSLFPAVSPATVPLTAITSTAIVAGYVLSSSPLQQPLVAMAASFPASRRPGEQLWLLLSLQIEAESVPFGSLARLLNVA